MRLLFLDDRRSPDDLYYLDGDDVVIPVCDVEQAIAAVEGNERFDVWSLDHDLQGAFQGKRLRRQAKTGYDFLVWAVEHAQGKFPSQVRIHSRNPDGAERMRQLVASYLDSQDGTQEGTQCTLC